jgi:hypothetical protein
MIDIDLIRAGDILLFHGNGFQPISVGIRTLTKSYWNHVGMIDRIGNDFFVIEALGKVEKNNITKYINNKQYDLCVKRLKKESFDSEEEYWIGIKTALDIMNKAVGKSYDVWSIVYLGLYYIVNIVWNPVGKLLSGKTNWFDMRSRFFCSELVCQACYKISSKNEFLFQGKTKQKCNMTTPKDIGKSDNVEYITGTNQK